MGTAFWVLISVIDDLLCWLGLSFRSTQSIEAENLSYVASSLCMSSAESSPDASTPSRE